MKKTIIATRNLDAPLQCRNLRVKVEETTTKLVTLPVSVAATLLQAALITAFVLDASHAKAEPPLGDAYADCQGKMENVGVYAGRQSSTRLLQILNCGEKVTVMGKPDENNWFKVKTQQGVEGYVWMFLSDHQSAVPAGTLPHLAMEARRAGEQQKAVGDARPPGCTEETQWRDDCVQAARKADYLRLKNYMDAEYGHHINAGYPLVDGHLTRNPDGTPMTPEDIKRAGAHYYPTPKDIEKADSEYLAAARVTANESNEAFTAPTASDGSAAAGWRSAVQRTLATGLTLGACKQLLATVALARLGEETTGRVRADWNEALIWEGFITPDLAILSQRFKSCASAYQWSYLLKRALVDTGKRIDGVIDQHLMVFFGDHPRLADEWNRQFTAVPPPEVAVESGWRFLRQKGAMREFQAEDRAAAVDPGSRRRRDWVSVRGADGALE